MRRNVGVPANHSSIEVSLRDATLLNPSNDITQDDPHSNERAAPANG
jgi:hypothetical protein